MARYILGLLLLSLSVPSFAESSTSFSKISLIQVNGKDGYYYFKTENGAWGPPECASAQWVFVNPAEVGVADQILSVALAAKIAGVRVSFSGYCDSSGNYLRADRLNIE